MENNFVGAAIAFVLGVVICFGNFKLSEYFLINHREKFHSVSFIRQLVQVIYIVALFFLAPYTPWDRTYVLIGAALGITLPMFLFTYRLLKTNKNNTSEAEKGDEKDG